MKSPGLTVKAAQADDGHAEFNEVLLRQRSRPRVADPGGLNNGWAWAHTLMYERLAWASASRCACASCWTARGPRARTKKNGVPVTQDPVMRQKLARCGSTPRCSVHRGARHHKLLRASCRAEPPGKMMWVEGPQRVQELPWNPRPLASSPRASEWAVRTASGSTPSCARGPNSYRSGTTEIQRNIMASALLGLPKGKP